MRPMTKQSNFEETESDCYENFISSQKPKRINFSSLKKINSDQSFIKCKVIPKKDQKLIVQSIKEIKFDKSNAMKYSQ